MNVFISTSKGNCGGGIFHEPGLNDGTSLTTLTDANGNPIAGFDAVGHPVHLRSCRREKGGTQTIKPPGQVPLNVRNPEGNNFLTGQ